MENVTYTQAFTDKIALLNIIQRRGIASMYVEFDGYSNCKPQIFIKEINVRDTDHQHVNIGLNDLGTLIEDVVVTELHREGLEWIGDHGGWGLWEYSAAREGRSATFKCTTYKNSIESRGYDDTSFMPTNWLSLYDEDSTSIYQRTPEGSEFIGNLIDTQFSDPANLRNTPRKDDFL